MEASQGTSAETSTFDFYHRAIVASILIGLAIIGLFGNILVIISVIVTKKLRTVTNILVVNLAFTDSVTCSCFPFQVAGLLSQTERYPLHEMICATITGVTYTCVCCSASTLVAIAFVRWYVITRSIRGYQGIHTPRKIATVAVIIWIESAAFIVLPPALGIGRLGYSKSNGMCAINFTTRLAIYYSMFLGIVVVIVLILTLTFYGLILCHVLRHNKQFRDKFTVDEDDRSSSTEAHQSKASSSVSPGFHPPMIKAINQKEIEITKNVFMVVCLFIFCFIATSVNLLIPNGSLSVLYGFMVLMTNSVVNPIIYGLKHPNFQKAFKRIICCRRIPLEHVSQ